MGDQISSAAQTILSDSLAFLIAMVCIQVFGVFRFALRAGGGDFTIRERLLITLPMQFVVMVSVAIVFGATHLGDLILVGHARPWWGLYVSILSITGAAGAAFIGLNYLRESRRPYSITDTSEATALAGEQYKRRIVLELKAAVLWILLAILAGGWLDKIGRSQM